MARLETVHYRPHRCIVEEGMVRWCSVKTAGEVIDLPQIFWRDGTPWREANLWALERAASRGVTIRTVQSSAAALLAYANWLEDTSTDWFDFPPLRSKRCLVRYRGALIAARDEGKIQPSTASERMRWIIMFYRWLSTVGLLSTTWPMWKERMVGIRLHDGVGFERTIFRRTTDLSIPNRSVRGERLEDGLLPISAGDRDALLAFAFDHSSEELFLMLTLGFFTGMRIGTLTDLKMQTLENAVRDPEVSAFHLLAVGPANSPPVSTKFSISGQVRIATAHLHRLQEYARSERRLLREAKANPKDNDLVFLTRFGNPYARRGYDKSVAINVEMHTLRRKAVASGLNFMKDFRFHQSRCTFATQLARIAIEVGGSIFAVAVVKDALLHKSEATALRYIKFVEKTPIKEAAANAFTRDFLGLTSQQETANDEETRGPTPDI